MLKVIRKKIYIIHTLTKKGFHIYINLRQNRLMLKALTEVKTHIS